MTRKKHQPATGPQDITTQPKASAHNITTQPKGPPAADAPGPLGGLPLWGAGVLLVLVLVVAWAVVGMNEGEKKAPTQPGAAKPAPGKDWATILLEKARRGELRKPWEPPLWKPTSEADRLVDRFVAMKKDRNDRAYDLLGGTPLIADEVIDEIDLERRATDTYLRQPFKITAIYRGEPDDRGGQKLTANRYTIAGVGPLRTPIFRARDSKGTAGLTSPFITKEAELVVEVRGGKIHGVRSTSGR